MPNHTLPQIFAVLNAGDTYEKLKQVISTALLPDDYHKFMFAYLAHGNGLKAKRGKGLSCKIEFTSEEMDILEVAADIVKRQPSFNADQLKKALDYHRGDNKPDDDGPWLFHLDQNLNPYYIRI